MKIKLLAICLLLLSSQVFADPDYKWKYMAEGKTYFWYWDSKNLTEKNDNYLLWVLYDNKYIEKGIGSQVALIEIDCAYNRYKNIYIESYDGQMAKGRMLHKMSSEDLPDHDLWKWTFMIKNKNIHNLYFLSYCDKRK